jgi:hypothetical protein
MVPSRGRSRFDSGLPEVWGVFIVCGFVTHEQFITKLKEVARMVESLITTNRFWEFSSRLE